MRFDTTNQQQVTGNTFHCTSVVDLEPMATPSSSSASESAEENAEPEEPQPQPVQPERTEEAAREPPEPAAAAEPVESTDLLGMEQAEVSSARVVTYSEQKSASLEDAKRDFEEDPAEDPAEDVGADVRDLAGRSKAIR